MKGALCIAGMPRLFEGAFDSIKRNIIRYNSHISFDIFVDIWDDRGYWVPGNGTNTKGIENIEKLNFDKVKKVYNTDNIVIENFDILESVFEEMSQYYFNHEYYNEKIKHSNLLCRVKNTLSWLYKCKKVNTQLKDNYDIVIRTRPDLIVHSPFKLNVDLNHINILNQSGAESICGPLSYYKGLGDKFIVSNQQNMNNISLLFNEIQYMFSDSVNNPDKLFDIHFFMYLKCKYMSTPVNIINFSNTIMHTPNGEYKARHGNTWTNLNSVAYEKIDRFKGKCGQ